MEVPIILMVGLTCRVFANHPTLQRFPESNSETCSSRSVDICSAISSKKPSSCFWDTQCRVTFSWLSLLIKSCFHVLPMSEMCMQLPRRCFTLEPLISPKELQSRQAPAPFPNAWGAAAPGKGGSGGTSTRPPGKCLRVGWTWPCTHFSKDLTSCNVGLKWIWIAPPCISCVGMQRNVSKRCDTLKWDYSNLRDSGSTAHPSSHRTGHRQTRSFARSAFAALWGGLFPKSSCFHGNPSYAPQKVQ